MENKNTSSPSLENLPDDVLRLIVSKVGASSPADYFNTVVTCKNLNFGLDDPAIAEKLNILPLVVKPDRASGYERMMELLAANNLDAHYVKGMCEFFESDNIFLGMHHLCVASKGAHKEAMYLYGVLLMALGMINKGKRKLSKLADGVGVCTVENIWVSVQRSLDRLGVGMKDVYVESLISMEPETDCHPPGVNTVCHKCYHAYLMAEFFELALGINPAPPVAPGV